MFQALVSSIWNGSMSSNTGATILNSPNKIILSTVHFNQDIIVSFGRVFMIGDIALTTAQACQLASFITEKTAGRIEDLLLQNEIYLLRTANEDSNKDSEQ